MLSRGLSLHASLQICYNMLPLFWSLLVLFSRMVQFGTVFVLSRRLSLHTSLQICYNMLPMFLSLLVMFWRCFVEQSSLGLFLCCPADCHCTPVSQYATIFCRCFVFVGDVFLNSLVWDCFCAVPRIVIARQSPNML